MTINTNFNNGFNRRAFLRKLGTTTLAGAIPFSSTLSSFNANAAETSGYKALVCVFFFGGMDGHDLVIPYDQSAYNEWANIRAPLLGIGGENGYGGSRDRSRLLPLTGAAQNGREFALPDDVTGLHELFTQGNASIVANTGPLVEPVNRQLFRDRSAVLPPRLFSHNDQQSVWMSFQPEGAPAGWGGRFTDMMLAADANPNATFTAISASGTSVFLQGDLTRPFQIDRNGAVTIRSAELRGASGFADIYRQHVLAQGSTATNLFERDMQDSVRFGIDANNQLDSALSADPTFSTVFPEGNNLAAQLSVIARVISRRSSLGANRQMFFVSAGGFDTHSNQARTLPALQRQFSEAIRAFYDVTLELGLQNDVTLFTSSDFGRTLRVNGDGTDHGWGNHHLVVGGAVNGGNIEGLMPETSIDHDQDSGHGRLIPTTSVEQYAAALGRWYGLSDTELHDALPGLNNFDLNQLQGLFL